MNRRLTEGSNIEYNGNIRNNSNLGEPVRCDCGWIVAYEKNGRIYLYCKKCKRQIPFVNIIKE